MSSTPAFRATSAIARSWSTRPSDASTRTSADVGPLRRLERAQLRVVLDPLPLVALAAEARRVDEDERLLAALSARCRSRRASCRGRPRRSRAPARGGRSAGSTCPRSAGRGSRRGSPPRRSRASPVARQSVDDLVEQIARAVPVHGRDRHRLAEARGGGTRARTRPPPARRACSRARSRCRFERAQDLGQLLVARRDAGPRVDDEEHEVGLARSPPVACSTIPRAIGDGSTTSTPPVSTIANRLPFHSQTSSLRSRVTPGVAWTTAARDSVSRLISVDLPTFG